MAVDYQHAEPIIRIHEMGTKLGGNWIHQHLNMEIYEGEILGIAGGSGSGKTTLLRRILMLDPITRGSIKILGEDIAHCDEARANTLRCKWGVMFQHSALFSSLTVLQNVMYPMRELTDLDENFIKEWAMLKIAMAGLDMSAASKLPAELSGGMQKRAAMARAIALDPKILFLDEPTAGLDPHSAGALDELVLHLRETLGLTVVIITHDLETLETVPDRVAFLGEGKVLMSLPMKELEKQEHPLVQAYFSEARRH